MECGGGVQSFDPREKIMGLLEYNKPSKDGSLNCEKFCLELMFSEGKIKLYIDFFEHKLDHLIHYYWLLTSRNIWYVQVEPIQNNASLYALHFLGLQMLKFAKKIVLLV